MATELRNVPTTDISQTRFAGGKDRGVCIQITQPMPEAPGKFNKLQLTRAQAQLVAQELLMFANGQEVFANNDDLFDKVMELHVS
jgi:hypothetical protein